MKEILEHAMELARQEIPFGETAVHYDIRIHTELPCDFQHIIKDYKGKQITRDCDGAGIDHRIKRMITGDIQFHQRVICLDRKSVV